MPLPIELISTDFDGTLFAEFENPPIPEELLNLISDLQTQGAKWVINTGREMASLMESLARARVPIQPDYLILVEREIFFHDGVSYVSLEEWNVECAQMHEKLFSRVRPDLPRLTEWVNARFKATVYRDSYSPFCLLADNNGDADEIHKYLEDYARTIPGLAVVRNDIYARFSHADYNKGTALAQLARRLKIKPERTFAIGDHLNDLPMLTREHAHRLAAPANAVEEVKRAVRCQKGYVSNFSCGRGVVQALKFYLDEQLAESNR